MNIDFVVNDYLLAWYVLFKPSFCEEVQELKEKLWNNYQKQYIAMQKDNIEILKYTKDFIPDDDTIYNLIFDTELFKELKKETEKYRQKLLEAWDKNKKAIKGRNLYKFGRGFYERGNIKKNRLYFVKTELNLRGHKKIM